MPRKPSKTVRQIREERIAYGTHSERQPLSYRLTMRFWLDIFQDDDFELAELIETLKAMGEFASTVRRGIRLIASLDAGRTDVLFDLFPWILDRLNKNIETIVSRHTRPLEAKIEMLQRQLEDRSLTIDVSRPPQRPQLTLNTKDLTIDESSSDDLWDDLADSLGAF